MADTLPDIRLARTAYTDLYAASGIPKGSPMIIQNKNNGIVYVQVKSTMPAAASSDGWSLSNGAACVVYGKNISGIWATGSGVIYVQVYE